MAYEIIGIIGTLFILLAFTFDSAKKIRVLDAVGAGFFVAYGLLTRTWSTAALNGLLICIHCIKMSKR